MCEIKTGLQGKSLVQKFTSKLQVAEWKTDSGCRCPEKQPCLHKQLWGGALDLYREAMQHANRKGSSQLRVR